MPNDPQSTPMSTALPLEPPPGGLIYSWELRQYVDGLVARLRDVTAERDAIWQALDRYGQHSPHCGYPNSFCKCGLLKVRAEFSRAALHQGQQDAPGRTGEGANR